MVWRVAERIVREPGEAEDVVQEAFVRIHQSFDNFDATRPLAPWAARITYHEALKRLGRVLDRRPEPSTDEVLKREAEPREEGPDDVAAARESGACIDAALGRLPAQDRALVTLHYTEGFSMGELSEASGMPVNTVKTRLRRARLKLKEALAPLGRGRGSEERPS